MKILYTAFNGKNNSSKILLDNLDVDNKLYLKNSFKTSIIQLQNELKNNYDLIISFGQAPLNNNTIKIETIGKGNNHYKTNYDFNDLKNKLEASSFNVIISNDAGNYLCNHIYYHGLKYISDSKLKCDMIFVHIPKNMDKIKLLAQIISRFEYK